jgi:glycerol-3-phosphate dehydrogenase (NAD(P)+)
LKHVAIAGGGSWGTALALILAARHESVRLWVHNPALAARMAATRENDAYLPGFPLPPNITVSSRLPQCLDAADAVVLAVPSHVMRRVTGEMLGSLPAGVAMVSATKGLEAGSLLRMSEVIAEVLLPLAPRIAVLSGPSFAREVAAGQPAAIVAASQDHALAQTVQAAFSCAMFRVYTSSDPIGVELGGAMKNVVAIGAGVCHGLGLGHNAIAALITRGLAEMSRLATAMGAQTRTLSGLAGLGDLVLTCTGDQSRNRRVGLELAKGRPLEEIIASMTMVAEGIRTTHSVVELGTRYGVVLPIATEMDRVIHFRRSPAEAIRRLMERSLRGE